MKKEELIMQYNFKQILKEKSKINTDINEHLYTLYNLSKECQTIVELGTRELNSTWAFLAAYPKKLISIDIVRPEKWGCTDYEQILKSANEQNINYSFIQECSEKVNLNKELIDLLFIDTIHTYDQVKAELENFSHLVTKYIVFHDTVLYGIDGYGHNGHEPGNGILRAINEFQEKNRNWKVFKEYKNNNGLLILKNEN